MGFFVRFIVADERGLSLEFVDHGLASAVPDARMVTNGERSRDVYFGDDAFWEIEVLSPGRGLFEEDRVELLDSLPPSHDENTRRVRGCLERASAILLLRVLQPGRDSDHAYDKLEDVWRWLFSNRTGLVCSDDGPHFYDETGLVL